MAVGTSVGEDDLRTMLARRSGLDEASLWYPVHEVPRAFGVSWPLTGDRAEDVLSDLLDGLRRTLPPPDEPSGARGPNVFPPPVFSLTTRSRSSRRSNQAPRTCPCGSRRNS
ncbi:hypothetical protein OG948_34270 (plasmid) [Embleya sp. NBC_00888]|uniref:hypothetical protein n=1 Tax=Embleya sp. NBC_00888 TaxID=2975960 RepID=UPI002F90914C|nr:hypothetical protein OG948_34270 [Embleya sp. NBC_00888]